MPVIADCHVHLYPDYDIPQFLNNAAQRLRAYLQGLPGQAVVLLVERQGQDLFNELPGIGSRSGGFVAQPLEPCVMSVGTPHGELLVVAGRQIATVERLEVLSYCAHDPIPDGLTLEATVQRSREFGGVPALAWAPGKWMFSRSRTVQTFLRGDACSPMILCDTTLRPRGWPIPAIMREAQRRGIRILAGTDPLPLEGEEGVVGRFGVRFDASLESGLSLSGQLRVAIAEMLQNAPCHTVGRRMGPIEWGRRYTTFMLRRAP